ncbi:MAG: acetate--CoA ligase family protein [Candidatus Odinarchaeum yellowstonii]|uniref:Acetate--CoA ligase family protein n=1 Tax=Odinarchaeota yellowstonii (strain LCB_4) TaxID=1841599 RepID=A0AAF0D2S6_ODILC|nr:MAG: acetate--CoA ligase family protein [Candidatus Odinarchaeum yellowstonii]
MSASARIKEIISNITNSGRFILTEDESKTILREMSIPFPEYEVVSSAEEAAEAAERVGYPIVMKIVSPDIIHKSDYGGVMLNLNNKREVIEGYNKILSNISKKAPGAKIRGVMIYKMASKGIVELLIGVSFDEQFGHTITVGLGGVFVELLKDISIRLIPISNLEAEEMLKELKAYSILTGFRGSAKADIDSIKQTLIKVSDLIIENPEILELDLNPVIVYEQGLTVIDARIILDREKSASFNIKKNV